MESCPYLQYGLDSDSFVKLGRNHVVECVGASGSAKSQFLLQSAVKSLLPKEGFGGWEGSVIWIDLDGHFDVQRLEQVLGAYIRDAGMLKESMERFYYTRCYNSMEFLTALKVSRNQLLRAQAVGKAVRILVIDSIPAFYYLDRAAPSTGAPTTWSLQVVMEAVVRALKELRSLSEPAELLVMVAKGHIFHSNSGQQQEFMPAVWQVLILLQQ